MPVIYQEVPRPWKERLLSLTPWKRTKFVRDPYAEAMARSSALREKRQAEAAQLAKDYAERSGRGADQRETEEA